MRVNATQLLRPSRSPPVCHVRDAPAWRRFARLLPYLWPEGDPGAKVRVVLAMGLLLLAKLATVYVPVVYGRIVDALAPKDNTALLAIPIGLVIGYGLLRMGSAVFGELRDALFAKVQQRAVRTAARRTFEHLHALSLRFHLDRQTGALARAIDRGSQAIQSVLRLAVFNVVPTVIELLLVTAIIWHLFDWRFAAITFGAVVSYAGLHHELRRAGARGSAATMNDTDNDASTKALDSLLNYETVKYFGNEPHEAARYDGALARYERAAVRVQVSLNLLNIGQAFIIAGGLTLIMLLASREVRGGTMTVGQFVLVNTYLMQLYQPLGFLGMVYMTIRQGLVDMEQMFRLLEVEREIADRPGATALAAHGPAGEVRFEGVQFGYRPDRAILRGHRFHCARRAQAGDRRADRGGQVHHQPAAVPLLRRDTGPHLHRRPGHPRRDAGEPARGDRRGAAGHRAVQRHHPLQHRLWPRRCDAGRDRARRAAGAGARFHCVTARWLRHPRGRAWAETVGRREAARGDRAHHPEGPAHPDPGRGDQRARYAAPSRTSRRRCARWRGIAPRW